ncbi:hypothetical protein [Hoeflea prorocentri]|uniref:Uncharacterized protein n=1 Tax=Hoeflea prorocentri TaxID=1922333 RepID=A0A9X3UQM2_9HYPH|nr:hypothetical protein [Hoeflea prorocentri]MCY6383421.1 hypothetical protein [Hoeflea prorocentri]MDA5401221.1 hypothetical protein [Hoeflea prorocentri]
MRNASPCLLALAAVLMLPVPGQTEDTVARRCPQVLAGYAANDDAVRLEFNGSDNMSFRFLVAGEEPYDGFVFEAENEPGIAGVILDNCPDGDVTGVELDACTVWRGHMYGIDDNGGTVELGAADAPAVGQLHLKGLAEALTKRLPDLAERIPQDQIERLNLVACQE